MEPSAWVTSRSAVRLRVRSATFTSSAVLCAMRSARERARSSAMPLNAFASDRTSRGPATVTRWSSSPSPIAPAACARRRIGRLMPTASRIPTSAAATQTTTNSSEIAIWKR